MDEDLLAREIAAAMSGSAAAARPVARQTIAKSANNNCVSVTLPAGGVIFLSNGNKITLEGGASFRPSCESMSSPAIIASSSGGGSISKGEVSSGNTTATTTSDTPDVLDLRDPFYASTFPQCYALAATTVIAYTLVIMLFITPRSFLDGGVVVLGRRGFTNGGTGVNIGGRPWLQKVAALTVAISLTIATADTFEEAENQYSNAFENAALLQELVLGGTELKVIRIISDTFLWLAQAQTLIRLFPRHREKVIIKWTAFALIILDVIFQSLNSFQYTNQGATRPRNFSDAVPALSYLFELSLGVLYAAWVIYYSLMKKRYAFYHQQMKNICLVAVLSIVATLVPIVFFILDVSKPDFTGWGDYVRWVGAAAASVIVWEWVERIEALEREEKKDGILGREVFDGDEMVNITPSDFTWPRRRKRKGDDDDEESGSGAREQTSSGSERRIWPSASAIVSRYKSRSRSRPREARGAENPENTESSNNERMRFLQPPNWPARPQPTATPISRADTASAASTVYAVRYHPLSETTSQTTPPPAQTIPTMSCTNSTASNLRHGEEPTIEVPPTQTMASETSGAGNEEVSSGSSGRRWRKGIPLPRLGRAPSSKSISNPIKPTTTSPAGLVSHEDSSRWDIRARLEEFAANQAEKFRDKIRPPLDTDNLEVHVIPAPPRAGAGLAQLREEEEHEVSHASPHRSDSFASRTTPAAGDNSMPNSALLYHSNTTASASSRQRPSPPLSGRDPPTVLLIPAPPRRKVSGASTEPSPVAMRKRSAEDGAPAGI